MQSKIIQITFVILLYLKWIQSASFGQSSDFTYPLEIKQFESAGCKTSDGENGVCKKASNCPSNQFKPTNADICFFDRNDPFYCCRLFTETVLSIADDSNKETKDEKLVLYNPDTLTLTTSSPTTTLDSSNSELWPIYREADSACDRHRPFVSYEDAFVGGIEAIPDEHPYMTAIGWTQSPGVIDWNCGGIVISEKFVLTAAHCTSNRGIAPDIVRVGDINLLLTNDTKTDPDDYTIRKIHIHPDYKHSSFYHDIALLEINDEFKYSLPSCVWPQNEIPVDQLLGMGYGTRKFSGPRSNILYQGNLTIVPNDVCSTKLQSSSDLPNGILSGQLCAHDPKRMVDTCQGDSGGPLIFFNGNAINVRPMVVGITSFGSFCAGSFPGVYTKVFTYLDWIESVVWPKKSNSTQ